MQDSKKTSTITFRLDETLISEIKNDASDLGISTNILVNQIFKRHVQWEKYQEKIGMVPIPRVLLIELLSYLADDQIKDVAKKIGHEIINDATVFMGGSMSLDSFLSWFKIRLDASPFDVNHKIDGGCHTIIVKHDLGMNWSLYHKNVFEYVFMEIFEKSIDIDANKSMFVMKFCK